MNFTLKALTKVNLALKSLPGLCGQRERERETLGEVRRSQSRNNVENGNFK